VSILRTLLWSNPQTRKIEIRTVDGYQGREKEVVVISFVRANDGGDVGFLDETRRVNVSVTRAKKAAILIGDAATLRRDEGLRSLIKHCEAKGAHVKAKNVLDDGILN